MTTDDKTNLRYLGASLGRELLAQAMMCAIAEWQKDPSYKHAMFLAGFGRAIADAAKFDEYWEEKTQAGYRNAIEILEYTAEQVTDSQMDSRETEE